MRELSPLKQFRYAHSSLVRSFIYHVEDFEICIMTSGMSALVQVGRNACTTPVAEWCRTSATNVIGISVLVLCHMCKNSSVD
jgi:hypothetical protein